MIVLQDLSLQVKGTPLLNDVSVSIRKGDITAIVGASGCGKSTLAHALLGDLPPDVTVSAGSIAVSGVDPLSLRGPQLRAFRRRCSYVDQDPGSALPPHESVRDILVRALRRRPGASRRYSDAHLLGILEPFGLSDLTGILDRTSRQLSGGQRRRVGVAAGIASQPELIIFDEPTAGLDSDAANSVVEAVRTSHQLAGATTILITHDVSRALSLADKAYTITHNRLSILDAQTPRCTASAAPSTPGSASEKSLLRISDAHVSQSGHVLLSGLSCELRRGEIVAFHGPSGVGKTTLLRGILGLSPLTAGQLSFDGSPLAPHLSRRPTRIRRRFGWVPQSSELALNPALTIGTQLKRTGASATAIDDICTALELDDAHLTGHEHTGLMRAKPDDLSGGQRQRVSLALGVLRAPDVLVCDEPTSALNTQTAELVVALLRKLASQGTAIILTTHDDRVLAASDRTIDVRNYLAAPPATSI